MSNFNNNEYQSLVADVIGDVFYKDISLSGKISFVRKYAEVIVRKILDISPGEAVTLGASNIQKKLKTLPSHEFIESAVEIIRGKGNQSIHTQHLECFKPEDFDKVVDALFDMLSFLIINYFEKYEFGTRMDVLSSFSLLPPIIRYKVLVFLYKKHPDNISVIDKLVLATVKAFSADEATKWVEREKEILTQMGTVTERAYNEIVEKEGVELAEIIRNSSPANMYLLCKMKISQVGDVINSRGVLYSDFESALPYYKSKGILIGDDLETKEFNDIMNFLYLGRKEKMKEISNESNPYIVLNFFSKTD